MTRVVQGWLITAMLPILLNLQMSALRSAAGGNPDGRNLFQKVVVFGDNLGGGLMWFGSPICVIALIVGGILYALGNSSATAWLGGAVVGFACVLFAPAIMA